MSPGRSSNPPLACYVSGHGFGHATRTAAVLAELRALDPGLEVHVRSDAPDWIFRERDPDALVSRGEIDAGMRQRNALDIDLPATLAAHERFCESWEERAEGEAEFLREIGAGLVVSDIAPLAFAAAARAGLPAIGVANFSWDWILEAYIDREPRFRPIAARYARAYAGASLLLRLPLCGPFPAFPRIADVPLVVNRSRRSRDECRRALGIPAGETRRCVLLSFGGFGRGGLGDAVREDLPDLLFLPTGAGRPSALLHEDLVQACDAVLGKPGYGTAAEVLAHGRRFLYLPREDFREIPALLATLEPWGGSREMPRADFERGRWRPHLDALFARPEPPAWRPADGARRVAEALRAALQRR